MPTTVEKSTLRSLAADLRARRDWYRSLPSTPDLDSRIAELEAVLAFLPLLADAEAKAAQDARS